MAIYVTQKRNNSNCNDFFLLGEKQNVCNHFPQSCGILVFDFDKYRKAVNKLPWHSKYAQTRDIEKVTTF